VWAIDDYNGVILITPLRTLISEAIMFPLKWICNEYTEEIVMSSANFKQLFKDNIGY
jgi:hypothetical protein